MKSYETIHDKIREIEEVIQREQREIRLLKEDLETLNSLPERHGKPWQNQERLDLWQRMKEGHSIGDIADMHARTIGAIICQLKVEWRKRGEP